MVRKARRLCEAGDEAASTRRRAGVVVVRSQTHWSGWRRGAQASRNGSKWRGMLDHSHRADEEGARVSVTP